MKPQRHKPDTAKGSAPKGPVQPIGPRNSERKPAKRRKGAQEEPSPPEEEGGPCDTCPAEGSEYQGRKCIACFSGLSCWLVWGERSEVC